MIETDPFDLGNSPGILNLVGIQSVVVLPSSLELLKLSPVRDANG